MRGHCQMGNRPAFPEFSRVGLGPFPPARAEPHCSHRPHVLSRVQDTTVSTHGACWPGPGGQHTLQPSACDILFYFFTQQKLLFSTNRSPRIDRLYPRQFWCNPRPTERRRGPHGRDGPRKGSGRDAQPLCSGADGVRNVGESWEQQGGNLYCSPTASGPAAANATHFMQRNLERGTGGDAAAESSSSMMVCCQLEPDTLSLSLSHTHAHKTAVGASTFPHLHQRRSGTQLRCEGRRHLHHHPTRASIGPGPQSLELPDKGLEPI